jgi:Ion channel
MRQSVSAPISATRDALGRLFLGRCFYLFVTLLTLIALAPFVDAQYGGLMVRYVINSLVMLAAVAAVGRSIVSFVVVLAMAAPALACRWLALHGGDPTYIDLGLRLDAGVYVATIGLLLRFVFDQQVLTSDRLWGAAAAYLMIGVLWSVLYTMIDRFGEPAFAIRGQSGSMQLNDLLYFSFGTLTTSGFGDIVPVTPVARTAAMVEGIVGQLFMAILIARLVGVYPQSGLRQ